ncbi:MAG: CopD family protein [Nitrosomonas sp.]|uniref:CopD family protein n=1 Tax=Nitrosomonas sp. TaxID=42353 RepID=UPI002737598F|nr:CopD family protein [Nitrosomonas sp.]MDP3663692.1 CopD family protein [Nitrosomonas sp.]MDZ4105636.1 CopD family protein [Nitrosomonas sp.]
MIEIIAAFARWSQLTANLILFGSCVFFAIIGSQKTVFETPWVMRLEKGFPWLAGVVLLGLIGILATTTSEATANLANFWSPAAWLKIVQQTQIGHIWAARAFLTCALLGVILLFRRIHREQWHYFLWATAASLPLIAGTLMSHSSADEMSFQAVVPYALHILFAGVWFGALPAFLFILYSNHSEPSKPSNLTIANYLKKFSAIALPAMVLLVMTGLIVTDRLVETFYHTLVSSPYGWLLNAKLSILAIILVIAFQARNKWIPMLSGGDAQQNSEGVIHLKKWVGIEFILALLLVLIATVLANTLPAKHMMIDNWPYPFRFSINATWDEPNVQEMVWSGVVLFFVALGTVWLGAKNDWNRMKRILVPGLLGISSMAIALPPLAIEAYPETYLKPTVPFDAISISNGFQLFTEHCVNCHGPQGKGTGTVVDPDVRDPTDLLTEQHTAKYTVGNVFHYLSHGIPGTKMSGFAASLSEEDRWDLINFLHALSRGFDARLLGTMIVPESPVIASPVFNYSASDGSDGNLKDFRLQKNVVLVLFSWPQAKERFFQLAAAYDRIKALNTEILAVPIHALGEQELQQVVSIVPFPVVTEGWSEIKNSYWLYRRIRTVPDLSRKGMFPAHMEFVTDRFGYLRARWVAQFEGFGWQNISALTLQLTQLNQEGEIMPPPGDHAH